MAVKLEVLGYIALCLRIFQVILAVTGISIVAHSSFVKYPDDFAKYQLISEYGGMYDTSPAPVRLEVVSFIIGTGTFLAPSLLFLVTTLHNNSFDHMRKSIFELVFNIYAAVSQTTVSLSLLSYAFKTYLKSRNDLFTGAAIGLFVAILYAGSTVVSIYARKAPSGRPI